MKDIRARVEERKKIAKEREERYKVKKAKLLGRQKRKADFLKQQEAKKELQGDDGVLAKWGQGGEDGIIWCEISGRGQGIIRCGGLSWTSIVCGYHFVKKNRWWRHQLGIRRRCSPRE